MSSFVQYSIGLNSSRANKAYLIDTFINMLELYTPYAIVVSNRKIGCFSLSLSEIGLSHPTTMKLNKSANGSLKDKGLIKRRKLSHS